jgi:alpha-tubulin suppressor-like RCC1 family protein
VNVLTFGPQHAIDSISCGRDHTLALFANGKVFGWGGDGSGRLPPGIPEYCSTSNPATRAVEIETRSPRTSVSAGHGISLGITVTKRVLVWGANPAAAGGWGRPTRSSRREGWRNW